MVNVWPGIAQTCDCLERAGDERFIYPDIICERTGETGGGAEGGNRDGGRGEHASDDCKDNEA